MNVICRAELFGSPTREQYDHFHALMSGLGLERTITRDGKRYHLPTGEYLGVNVSSLLFTLTLQITKAALDVTSHTCKVTLTPVADVNEIVIAGLEEDQSYAAELSYYFNLVALARIAPQQPTTVPALGSPLRRAMENAGRPNVGALLRAARSGLYSRRNG